jgi:hypothetical protein
MLNVPPRVRGTRCGRGPAGESTLWGGTYGGDTRTRGRCPGASRRAGAQQATDRHRRRTGRAVEEQRLIVAAAALAGLLFCAVAPVRAQGETYAPTGNSQPSVVREDSGSEVTRVIVSEPPRAPVEVQQAPRAPAPAPRAPLLPMEALKRGGTSS